MVAGGDGRARKIGQAADKDDDDDVSSYPSEDFTHQASCRQTEAAFFKHLPAAAGDATRFHIGIGMSGRIHSEYCLIIFILPCIVSIVLFSIKATTISTECCCRCIQYASVVKWDSLVMRRRLQKRNLGTGLS